MQSSFNTREEAEHWITQCRKASDAACSAHVRAYRFRQYVRLARELTQLLADEGITGHEAERKVFRAMGELC